VNLDAERAQTDPKVFTRIPMHFRIPGTDLEPDAVGRAVALSAQKYCSAAAMLAETAAITHDSEIVPE